MQFSSCSSEINAVFVLHIKCWCSFCLAFSSSECACSDGHGRHSAHICVWERPHRCRWHPASGGGQAGARVRGRAHAPDEGRPRGPPLHRAVPDQQGRRRQPAHLHQRPHGAVAGVRGRPSCCGPAAAAARGWPDGQAEGRLDDADRGGQGRAHQRGHPAAGVPQQHPDSARSLPAHPSRQHSAYRGQFMHAPWFCDNYCILYDNIAAYKLMRASLGVCIYYTTHHHLGIRCLY